MRTQQQFLNEYAKSHQNPVNTLIHIVCVPAIFFSTIGLFWAIPLGAWLGLPAQLAPWVNAATLGAIPAAVFYARLSLGTLAVMTLWYLASIALVLAIQQAGWPLVWVCAGIWVASWIVQFIGHEVEGAKPSFADDLLFLLVGPLFVMEKAYRRFGLRPTRA